MALPLPATTHLCFLLHCSPVNLSARDAPGTVPFPGNDIHQRSKEDLVHGENSDFRHESRYIKDLEAQWEPTYLEEHCKPHGDETLGGIVKTSEAIGQPLAAFRFECGVPIR